jgi:hypothetical protein
VTSHSLEELDHIELKPTIHVRSVILKLLIFLFMWLNVILFCKFNNSNMNLNACVGYCWIRLFIVSRISSYHLLTCDFYHLIYTVFTCITFFCNLLQFLRPDLGLLLGFNLILCISL